MKLSNRNFETYLKLKRALSRSRRIQMCFIDPARARFPSTLLASFLDLTDFTAGERRLQRVRRRERLKPLSLASRPSTRPEVSKEGRPTEGGSCDDALALNASERKRFSQIFIASPNEGERKAANRNEALMRHASLPPCVSRIHSFAPKWRFVQRQACVDSKPLDRKSRCF